MNRENQELVKSLVSDGIHDGFKKSLKTLSIYLIIGYAIMFLLRYSAGDFDRDTTDGERRSGMGLHVDAETGCEYLSTMRGGITPRISYDGTHKGCRAPLNR